MRASKPSRLYAQLREQYVDHCAASRIHTRKRLAYCLLLPKIHLNHLLARPMHTGLRCRIPKMPRPEQGFCHFE